MGRLSAVIIVMMLSLGPLAQAWDVVDSPTSHAIPDVNNPPVGIKNNDDVDISLSSIGGHFTENLGQLDDDGIRLYCLGEPLSVAFGKSTVAYDYCPPDQDLGVRFEIWFDGSNQIAPLGLQPMLHRINYFIGNVSEDWVTGARNFREVVYPNLYDGIDMRFTFGCNRLKYEFIVAPQVDPGQIVLAYGGIEELIINERTGDLHVLTAAGTVRDESPLSYQNSEGTSSAVYSSFKVLPDDRITFELGDYDETLPLIIDPGLEFSTFIGGSGGDGWGDWTRAGGSHVDSDMNVYIASMTKSPDFPVTAGAYSTTLNEDGGLRGKGDAFVCKLRHDGSALLYATFIGGTSQDGCLDMHVDEEGNVYGVGGTRSFDFPTTSGVFQRYKKQMGDCFIFKLDPTGSSLIFSSFLGGNHEDPGWDQYGSLSEYPANAHIEVDRDETIVIAGETVSEDFPTTPGSFRTRKPGDVWDPFITRINANCTKILYSTYIGGSAGDSHLNMRIDDNGSVFLTGQTASDDFPVTPGAYQTRRAGSAGWIDGFILKMEPDLSRLEFSTYVGGSEHDWFDGLVLDEDGNVIVTGFTRSSNFPTTPGALDDTLGSFIDMVALKLNASGDRLLFSTYLLETPDETWVSKATLDGDGKIMFGILTHTTDLPISTNAYCRTFNGGFQDIYLGILDSNGTALLYGSYFGGNKSELLYDIHWSPRNTTLVGMTYSPDFPTTMGAFCETMSTPPEGGVNADVFVTRMAIEPVTLNTTSPPCNLTCTLENQQVNLVWDPPSSDGNQPIIGYRVYKGLDPDTMYIEGATSPYLREFIDRDVLNGITYYYTVAAYTRFGEGEWSPIINATPYDKAKANLNFKATPGCSSVSLTWTPPPDTGGYPLLGYRLYRGTTELNIPLLINLPPVTVYQDDNLTNGEEYFYRLRAFTEIGDGLLTDRVSVIPIGPPDVPANIFSRDYDQAIDVRWSPPGNNGGRKILGYNLYMGSSCETLELIVTLDPVVRLYNVTNLTNGVRYYFAVTAFNELGEGPLSRVTTKIPYGAPSVPLDPVAIGGNGSVYIHWGRPIEEGGDGDFMYHVWLRDETGMIIDALPTFNLSFVWTGLENGVTYWFTVNAVNKGGFGKHSAPMNATAMTISRAPLGVDIIPGERSLELSWFEPDDTGGTPIEHYIVYRGETKDSLDPYKEVEAGLPVFVDTDVVDGQTYFYKVTAVTVAGESPATRIVDAVAWGPPGPPLGLVAVGEDETVTLTWSTPAFDGGRDIWRYIIMRGDSLTDTPEIARVGVTLTYTDTDVENGRTYYYRIAAENSIGDGPGSNFVDATPVSLRGPPGAPRDLQAVLDRGAVMVTWSPPELDGGSPILLYTVLRGTSPDDLRPVRDVGLSLRYIDGHVERGVTYYYSVVAGNLMGEGEPAQPVNIQLRVQQETDPDPLPIPFPWLLIIILVIITSYATVSISTTESGRYRWGLLLGPLTTRIRREEVLDNKTRFALHGMIREHPGIHYNALMREFDLKNGAAAYHLMVLEKERYIRSARDGRLKRFYPTDVKIPDDFRMTPEEIKETILEMVVANPGISQKEIVNELDMKDITVRYHLRAMVADGTLRDAKKGKLTIYYRDT